MKSIDSRTNGEGESSRCFSIRCDLSGRIVAMEGGIQEIFGRETAGPADASLWSFLEESDAKRVRGHVKVGTRVSKARLAWKPGRVRTEGFLEIRDSEIILVGEVLPRGEGGSERGLTEVNNRLTVLLRENRRKSKLLARAKGELEKTLRQLGDSKRLWQKIQEVLPVCLGCSKVKTNPRPNGDEEWQEIVEYLVEQDLFVSHGYCPDCMEAYLMELDES